MAEDTNPLAALADFMQDFETNCVLEEDIQYPIEVEGLKVSSKAAVSLFNPGQWVAVRPASSDKTYLGIYLGDLVAQGMRTVYYHKTQKVVTVINRTNPALWVPDLNRIVWGYESWWGALKSPDDLKKITDQDIENVWYVRALRELSEKDDPA